MKKQIDIVVPCYNEEGNIKRLHQEIDNIFREQLPQYDYSIIFVNDGSSDGSLYILQKMGHEYSNIKYLSFSRNFGHQIAVKAGMDKALGDAVISMDCDLQHPPNLIPTLVQHWEAGNEVVATIRQDTKSISTQKQQSSHLFYKFLNLLSDIEIKDGTADFRLLDKKVIAVIRTMNENEPFLRGIIPWIGFQQIYIPYVAQERFSGQTKYTMKKMINLALAGITAFSVKPLYIAVFLGFIFSALSLLYIPYVCYAFISRTEISGWASLIMTIVFFGGLNLIILGIIGIYIGKIFKQTKERPSYIISEEKL